MYKLARVCGFRLGLFIALMRCGAERGQGAAPGLHADPPVLCQIIIDKYPAAGQYIRLLLQTMTGVSVRRRATLHTAGTKLLRGQFKIKVEGILALQNQMYRM